MRPEVLAKESTGPEGSRESEASTPRPDPDAVDRRAVEDFRRFLAENREQLSTGLGAFHHDDHSNW
jgi:hypothetical protein